MRQGTIARRYAAALLRTAIDANVTDAVESDLKLILELLVSVPGLSDALTHPLIPPASKKSITSQVFEGRVQAVTLDFLHLLSDKRREDTLSEVNAEYARLADEHRGFLPVTVTSAVGLSDDDRDRLRERLNEYLGKRVDLHVFEDSALIGGLMVRIEDTVIDGSIRGYLEALRTRMLAKE